MPHWVEPGQPQLLTEQGGQQKKKKKKKKKKRRRRRKRKYGRAGQSGAHRKPPPKVQSAMGGRRAVVPLSHMRIVADTMPRVPHRQARDLAADHTKPPAAR